MKTFLFLLMLGAMGCAEETGIFGPIDRHADQAGAIDTFGVMTNAMSVWYVRDKAGNSQFAARSYASAKVGARDTQITKEQFTKCYHLASKVIRELRRSGYPQGPAYEIHYLTIHAGNENLFLSYEAGAIKDNPLLADLLAMMETLSQPR